MSLDRRQSLAGVPVLHESVVLEPTAKGELRVTMRVERGAGFFEKFRPPVSTRSYDLDEFGAFVLKLVDGRRTVQDLVELFEAQYRMSHRECELSVVAFLKLLMKRQVLAVVVPTTHGAPVAWQGLQTGSGRTL